MSASFKSMLAAMFYYIVSSIISIIFTKMAVCLSIFHHARCGHWNVEIGNYLELGIWYFNFFLIGGVDAYLLVHADQGRDRVNTKLFHDTAANDKTILPELSSWILPVFDNHLIYAGHLLQFHIDRILSGGFKNLSNIVSVDGQLPVAPINEYS